METEEKAVLTPEQIINTFYSKFDPEFEDELKTLEELYESFLLLPDRVREPAENIDTFRLYKRVKRLLCDIKDYQNQKGESNE